jgi:hypothetical protein
MKSLDLAQTTQHGLPEVRNIDLLADDGVGRAMPEVAVGPSSGFALDLDFDEGRPSDEVLRVQQVVDGAGIVGNGELELLVFLVLLLKEAEKRSHLLSEGGGQLAELCKNLLSDLHSVCHLQGHHHDRQARLEHDSCSLRVYKNVELGCGRTISLPDSPTH